MHRLSASKAALLSVCRYPFASGVVWFEKPNQFRDKAAAIGTAVGRLATQYINGQGFDAPEDDAVAARWRHLHQWLAKSMRPGWRSEKAYAMRLDGSVSYLGEDIDRAYPPGTFGGSADIEGDHYLADIKCKTKLSGDEWHQLIALAAMASVANKWMCDVTLSVIHVTPTGVNAKTVTVSQEQLERKRASLVAYMTDDDPAPQPGEHCAGMYCPHRLLCVAANGGP